MVTPAVIFWENRKIIDVIRILSILWKTFNLCGFAEFFYNVDVAFTIDVIFMIDVIITSIYRNNMKNM